MVSEVRWSQPAIDTYNEILLYLIDEWSEREVHKFAVRVGRKIELLQMQPRIGRLINTRKKNLSYPCTGENIIDLQLQAKKAGNRNTSILE